MEKKLIRKPRFAGKFEDHEKFEIQAWVNQPDIVKLSWCMYFHLLNQGVDPETWRFKRVFHSARKRKD